MTIVIPGGMRALYGHPARNVNKTGINGDRYHLSEEQRWQFYSPNTFKISVFLTFSHVPNEVLSYYARESLHSSCGQCFCTQNRFGARFLNDNIVIKKYFTYTSTIQAWDVFLWSLTSGKLLLHSKCYRKIYNRCMWLFYNILCVRRYA
jgi:hypothetical protein